MEKQQIIKENEEMIECENCGNEFKESEGLVTCLYSSAFSDGSDFHFCGDSCEDSYLEDTFYCNECNRQINCSCGHNVQYRWKESEEMMCLQCYEKQLYEEGITEDKLNEDLNKGSISGMFFNDGDLESEGFTEIKKNYINGENSVKEHNEECLKQVQNGNLVITELRHLSIMGNAGFVNIWTKKRGD